jgi:hypothetical protein
VLHTDFNARESALRTAALAAALVDEAELDALRDETWLAARTWRERVSPVWDQTERQDWEHEKIAVLASLEADRARMVELEEQLERKLAQIGGGGGGGGGGGTWRSMLRCER